MTESAPGLENNNSPIPLFPSSYDGQPVLALIVGNGKWSIYSSERELPPARGYGHHYILLVDPTGIIIKELHGHPSGLASEMQGFRMSGLPGLQPEVGNYLVAQMFKSDVFLREAAIFSQKLVKTFDSETEARQAFLAAYNSVQLTLDQKHFLYDGAAFFIGSGTSRNSNSLWFTGLKALGVKDPLSFLGPLIAPGKEVDLEKAETNNWMFLSKDPDVKNGENRVYLHNTAPFRHS